MDEILSLLQHAISPSQVEMAMNMITLPDKTHSDFADYRSRLLPVFEKIIVVNGLTNKHLRRRMERMMFVLHDGNIGEKKKVLPVIDRSLYEYKPKQKTIFNSKIAILHESFHAFVNLEMKDNITSADIEDGLDKIGNLDDDSTIDEGIKGKLLKILEQLGDNESLGLNSKLRRRLKRMIPTIESLASHKTTETVLTVSKKTLCEQNFNAFINLANRDGVTAADIEEGLDKIGNVDDDSTIDEGIKGKLLKALEQLGDNESLGLNSKLRRRLKRRAENLNENNESKKIKIIN